MAFSFDSAHGFSALLLGGVSGWSWARAKNAPARARLNLRFAAALFASLGVAGLMAAAAPAFLGAALAVALLAASLGTAALALALAGKTVPPLVAAIALGLGLLAALGAVVSGIALASVGFALLAGVAMLAYAAGGFCRSPWTASLTALAWMLGGACLLRENLDGGLLFFAAALWGAVCALQAGVENERRLSWRGSVSSPRS